MEIQLITKKSTENFGGFFYFKRLFKFSKKRNFLFPLPYRVENFLQIHQNYTLLGLGKLILTNFKQALKVAELIN